MNRWNQFDLIVFDQIAGNGMTESVMRSGFLIRFTDGRPIDSTTKPSEGDDHGDPASLDRLDVLRSRVRDVHDRLRVDRDRGASISKFERRMFKLFRLLRQLSLFRMR